MTTAFPGLLEDDEDLQSQALIEALRQQQRRGEAERAQLHETLGRQQGEAGGLRALSMISSFGDNPLLRNVRQTAGAQGSQLEGLAARTEGRLAGVDGGLDPLGVARAQQGAERLRMLAKREGRLAKETANKAATAEEKARKKAEDDALKLETGLRKEFMGQKPVEEYFKASLAFDKVRNAAKDPSPAGDLALIFGYMKVLDPGSVVKEGEFANAQNAANVPDRIRNVWNKALSGERLSPQQRQEFIASAGTQFAAHEAQYDAFAERYRQLAPEGSGDRVVMARPQRAAAPVQRVPMPPNLDLNAPAPPLPAKTKKAAPAGDMVDVISPDGTPGQIPRANLKKALKAGYKEAK